jgi:hypothetical protein
MLMMKMMVVFEAMAKVGELKMNDKTRHKFV